MKTLIESIIGRKGTSSITKQSLQEGDVVETVTNTFFIFVPKYYSGKHGAFITAVGNFGNFQVAANHITGWDDNLKSNVDGDILDIIRVYRKPKTRKFSWDVWKNPIELKDYINWIVDNVKSININQ